MAWNILALSGLVSLGHGAFFGLGAYAAILLEQNLHVPVYPAVLAGGFVGAFYGILWGFTFKKLRGAYFALASLASLEIPRVIVDNWDSLTSGSLGIVGIPRLPGLDLGILHLPVGDSMQAQYYFLLLWMVLVGAHPLPGGQLPLGLGFAGHPGERDRRRRSGGGCLRLSFSVPGVERLSHRRLRRPVRPSHGVDRAGHGLQPAVGRLPPGAELFWRPFFHRGADPGGPGAVSPGSTGFAALAAPGPRRDLRAGNNSDDLLFSPGVGLMAVAASPPSLRTPADRGCPGPPAGLA